MSVVTRKQKETEGSLKLAVASKSTKPKRSVHSTTVATANNNGDNTNITFDIVDEKLFDYSTA